MIRIWSGPVYQEQIHDGIILTWQREIWVNGGGRLVHTRRRLGTRYAWWNELANLFTGMLNSLFAD